MPFPLANGPIPNAILVGSLWLFSWLGGNSPALGATLLPLEKFDRQTTGKFDSWIDRRNLLVMAHPWVPSETGGFCEAKTTLTLPETVERPLRLSLYQTDDYFNDFWRAKNDSWLGGDGFYGHRFKQVWVNDELLWESDVADANAPEVSPTLVVDLPEEIARSPRLTITLRLVDKVSTWVRLASDTQHIGTTETSAERPGDPARFWTHVYWGDVQILSGTERTVPIAPPVQEKLRENLWGNDHRTALPPPPLPYSLRLSCSDSLPRGGYPVRCGVPLAAGIEVEPERLRLIDSSGHPIPARIERFGAFLENRPRWLAVEFLAKPGMEDSILSLEAGSPTVPGPAFQPAENNKPERVILFPGNRSGIETRVAGPRLTFASAEILFDPDHTTDLRVLPLLSVSYDPEEAVSFEFGYSDRIEETVLETGEALAKPPAWLAIRCGDEKHFLALRWSEGTESVRFRVRRKGTEVSVSLLPFFQDGKARTYPATPGEAKTFELLYCRLPNSATPEDCRRLSSHFNRPPLLIDTETLGRTGVWGKLLPPAEKVGRELVAFLEEKYPDPLGASFKWGKNLRDYGDIIYKGTDSWRNGYYDLRQGFAAAYLISGDRRWADALDRTVRHYLDVDTIHWDEDHPDDVGLPHGYGTNHTSMEPWEPIVRVNGIFAAAHLWANAEYFEKAIRMAKQTARTKRALGAISVRNHAGVLMTLASAYRETHDPLFKNAAKQLVEDIAAHRVDPRRGTYPEVHGNWNYRGNVPWMVVQLIEPLYIYYRDTGDLQAAGLLVGMADSILAENQTRGVPGDISGYSHNPHFKKTSRYHVLIAPCLFYAYELTGDESFREAGIAAWRQTVREETINDVLNCFWNTPSLVYSLRTLDRPDR